MEGARSSWNILKRWRELYKSGDLSHTEFNVNCIHLLLPRLPSARLSLSQARLEKVEGEE
jgi:hypothetical protein